MNTKKLMEKELSFVIDIEKDGFKIGQVAIPANTKSGAVPSLVTKAKVGLIVQMCTTIFHEETREINQ